MEDIIKSHSLLIEKSQKKVFNTLHNLAHIPDCTFTKASVI